MTTAKDLIRDFGNNICDMTDREVLTDEVFDELLDELMKEIADKICK